MKILFVCRANVYRSRMAEHYFKKMTKGYKVESAGTRAWDGVGVRIKDQGDADFVIETLKNDGIDIGNKVSRQLTRDMVEKADRVIVMAERETIPSWLMKNDKVEFWDVKDIKRGDVKGHIKTRERIKRLVKKLVSEIEKQD